MITWPALERAAQQAGWKRVGRTWRGAPCPSCGGGTRDTGGVLRLDVSLPPGSDKGPRILRRVLRRLGARSYPQWRAWLALAYLWDRSAVNGHWVRATRPRLARDSGGRLVDATGAAMLDKSGAPVTKWTDRRAVLLDAEGRPVPTAGEAARERNPDARLHPWLAPADIVALGYPPERGLSASALSMRKARVLEDLAAFEAEGLIAFEAHPDGRRPARAMMEEKYPEDATEL